MIAGAGIRVTGAITAVRRRRREVAGIGRSTAEVLVIDRDTCIDHVNVDTFARRVVVKGRVEGETGLIDSIEGPVGCRMLNACRRQVPCERQRQQAAEENASALQDAC